MARETDGRVSRRVYQVEVERYGIVLVVVQDQVPITAHDPHNGVGTVFALHSPTKTNTSPIQSIDQYVEAGEVVYVTDAVEELRVVALEEEGVVFLVLRAPDLHHREGVIREWNESLTRTGCIK